MSQSKMAIESIITCLLYATVGITCILFLPKVSTFCWGIGKSRGVMAESKLADLTNI